MFKSLWSSMGVVALLFGFASGVSAANQDKSWEVDIYGDGADVTYVPDGRDDIHIYDHNDHYNDRSYIEVEQPRYGDGRDYDARYDNRSYGGYDNRGYDGYDNRSNDGYDNRRYNRYNDHRSYAPRQYRQTRYRVEYHNRYRGW